MNQSKSDTIMEDTHPSEPLMNGGGAAAMIIIDRPLLSDRSGDIIISG